MKYYTSIKDLPFEAYKRLTIDDELQALVIEGAVPDDVLKVAKEMIVEEFNQKISEDYSDMVSSVEWIEKQNIDVARLKKTLIDFCRNPTSAHVAIFEAAGIHYSTDDLNDYKMFVFNSITSREMNMQLNIKTFEKRYGDDKDLSISHDYYENILSAVSDMKGREIDDNITTLRFVTYYKELIRYLEQQKHK